MENILIGHMREHGLPERPVKGAVDALAIGNEKYTAGSWAARSQDEIASKLLRHLRAHLGSVRYFRLVNDALVNDALALTNAPTVSAIEPQLRDMASGKLHVDHISANALILSELTQLGVPL